MARCAGALVLLGALAVTTGADAAAGKVVAKPERVFAPYIDMNLPGSENLLAIKKKSGAKVFTLAFIVSAGGSSPCSPAWGGIMPIGQDALAKGKTIQALVGDLRKAGGDVVIAFGGAAGQELALTCSSVTDLQAAYQAVIERYQATSIELDIEGAAAADKVSVSRRNQALVALRAANPQLRISYTLPATTEGLSGEAEDVLTSARTDRLTPDIVNIMTMDYGQRQTPSQMLANAKRAATGTKQRLDSLGMASAVGITPMIGVNDTPAEVFTLPLAKKLLSFAKSKPWVARLSMWSVSRDNGGCAGSTVASATCSGLKQPAYAFSAVFKQFGP